MEYREKKNMSGDALSVVKFLTSDIFQTRLLKMYAIATLIIHGFIMIIGSYYFIYVLPGEEFIKFTPVYFGTFYLLLAIFTILFKNNMISNINGDIPLWSFDTAGEKTYKQLKLEAIISNIWVFSTFLLGHFASFLLMWGHSHDTEMIFSFRLFEDWFPEHTKLLRWIVKSTFPIGAHLLIVHVYQLVYFIQHFRFQMVLFREHVVHIADIPENSTEEELFYESDYQEQINKRLIFCAKRYEELIRMYLVKVEEFKNLIAPFAICGCALGIGIFLYIFSGDLLDKEYYIPIGIVIITTYMTFLATMYICQAAETEADDLADSLIEINWYNFNKQNKLIYLIFLINIMKVRRVQFSENYSVNYELGIVIGRNVYSILTVVINLKNEKIGKI